jgi:hypothetical protein
MIFNDQSVSLGVKKSKILFCSKEMNFTLEIFKSLQALTAFWGFNQIEIID